MVAAGNQFQTQEPSVSNKSLSSVATAVIESYGNTAINMINAYRVGGERVIGFVDQRRTSVLQHHDPIDDDGPDRPAAAGQD
jgi:hypothetical protein